MMRTLSTMYTKLNSVHQELFTERPPCTHGIFFFTILNDKYQSIASKISDLECRSELTGSLIIKDKRP